MFTLDQQMLLLVLKIGLLIVMIFSALYWKNIRIYIVAIVLILVVKYSILGIEGFLSYRFLFTDLLIIGLVFSCYYKGWSIIAKLLIGIILFYDLFIDFVNRTGQFIT